MKNFVSKRDGDTMVQDQKVRFKGPLGNLEFRSGSQIGPHLISDIYLPQLAIGVVWDATDLNPATLVKTLGI